jgi:plasmid stabilization system protein ParE
MAAKYSLQWSVRAGQDLDNIYNFLLLTWTQKEAANFLDLVFQFEETVLKHPQIFPHSKKIRSCRIALIHQNVSAVYKITGTRIFIVTLIDNRAKSRYR